MWYTPQIVYPLGSETFRCGHSPGGQKYGFQFWVSWPTPVPIKKQSDCLMFSCVAATLCKFCDSQSVGVSLSCIVSGAPSQFWRSFSQLPAQRQLMQTPPQKSSGLCWIEASGLNQCTKQTEFILKTTALYTTTALCKQIEISSQPPSSIRDVQSHLIQSTSLQNH